MGKSTLLSNLAGVYSEVAAYEFTTLTTVPGCIKYKGAKIQVIIYILVRIVIEYFEILLYIYNTRHPIASNSILMILML